MGTKRACSIAPDTPPHTTRTTNEANQRDMTSLLKLTQSRRRRQLIAGIRSAMKVRQAYSLHSQLTRRGVSHTFIAVTLGALLVSSCLSSVAANGDSDSRPDKHRNLMPSRGENLWERSEIEMAKEKIKSLKLRVEDMIDRLEVKSIRPPTMAKLLHHDKLSDLLVLKDAFEEQSGSTAPSTILAGIARRKPVKLAQPVFD